jgi:exodeoxyribonuclease VII small subunit
LRYVRSFPPAIQFPLMSKPVKPDAVPTFESALTELEGIVARMEDGQLSLEESLSAYKRGAELLKVCQAQLADAQQQVKMLEAGALRNFAPDDDDNE